MFILRNILFFLQQEFNGVEENKRDRHLVYFHSAIGSQADDALPVIGILSSTPDFLVNAWRYIFYRCLLTCLFGR
jgi:hypothetical protein